MGEQVEKNLKDVYFFDVVQQGIYYQKRKVDFNQDFRLVTAMRNYVEGLHALKRSHFIDTESSLTELENFFKQKAQKARAGKILYVLGYNSDPFRKYNRRYEYALKLIEAFSKYKSGHMYVQTCSELLVLGLTRLLPAKNNITVAVPIETNDPAILRRYSQSEYLSASRFKLVRAMQNFSFDVEIHVAPLFPYRNRQALKEFAAEITASCSRAFVSDLHEVFEHKSCDPAIVMHFKANKHEQWLKKGVASALKKEILALDAEFLIAREISSQNSEQLNLWEDCA